MLSSSFRRFHSILMTSSHNPYLNLSKILDLSSSTQSDGKTLYVWRNSPVVIIGRHQNPHKECNLPYMQSHDVQLARRPIGGPAEYHDLGDTCWAFVESRADPRENLGILTRTLGYLGLRASQDENGILNVANRQFLRSLVVPLGRQTVHHGVFRVNPNWKVATGSLLRRSGTLGPSLSDINPMVNHEGLCEAFVHSMKGQVKYLDPKTMMDETGTMENFKELSSSTWIFGKAPILSETCVSRDFGFGTFDVALQVEGSRLKEAHVNSDCVLGDVVEKFEACINKFARSALPTGYIGREYVESLKTPQEQEMAEALITWIVPEMKKLKVA
jgi:lipoate-protein ligase A